MLPLLGGLVALATLALGAARQVSLPPGVEHVPAVTVAIFGLVGTVFVAVVYGFARQALRSEGYALVAVLSPLATVTDPDVVAELGHRTAVEGHLGLSTTLLSELNAAIFILGPLLAGLVARYIGSSGDADPGCWHDAGRRLTSSSSGTILQGTESGPRCFSHSAAYVRKAPIPRPREASGPWRRPSACADCRVSLRPGPGH